MVLSSVGGFKDFVCTAGYKSLEQPVVWCFIVSGKFVVEGADLMHFPSPKGILIFLFHSGRLLWQIFCGPFDFTATGVEFETSLFQ